MMCTCKKNGCTVHTCLCECHRPRIHTWLTRAMKIGILEDRYSAKLFDLNDDALEAEYEDKMGDK